jgi:hypothetical protein
MKPFHTIRLGITALAVLTIATTASALTDVEVTFDGETPFMNVPNGYSSPESSAITFSDSVGANLQLVQSPVVTAGSVGLAAFFDHDGSALEINIAFLASIISMDIGNDSADPLFTNAGDAAVLKVFLDTVQVGSVSLELNRNSLMDQRIEFDGLATGQFFNSATLEYETTGLMGLTEVIDNVRVTPIPEPTAALVFGVGTLTVGMACRRRNQSDRG